MPPQSCAAFNYTKLSEVLHLTPMQPLSKLGAAGKFAQLFFVQKEKFAEGCKAEGYRVVDCGNAGKICDVINFATSAALQT